MWLGGGGVLVHITVKKSHIGIRSTDNRALNWTPCGTRNFPTPTRRSVLRHRSSRRNLTGFFILHTSKFNYFMCLWQRLWPHALTTVHFMDLLFLFLPDITGLLLWGHIHSNTAIEKGCLQHVLKVRNIWKLRYIIFFRKQGGIFIKCSKICLGRWYKKQFVLF